MVLVSYCNDTWPSVGGVARYDTQLALAFPDRVFFRGPQEKDQMLKYLETADKPVVITDNHLACDVPNEYPLILVHHGCARTTAERNPSWDKYWRDLCCNGQERMLHHRDPAKTLIVSISKSCTDDFTRFFGKDYLKFDRRTVLHPSELDQAAYKNAFVNPKPVILGNWSHMKKGRHLIPILRQMLPEFEFRQLAVLPRPGENINGFNARKQAMYLGADMFLQVANSEGFSYASHDAMICGLVPVCTNVGAFYGDVPADCFASLDWEKCYGVPDFVYITTVIRGAWDSRHSISENARRWYIHNTSFDSWAATMKELVSDFAAEHV